jgi:TDG/mug DNA glycosylase family protein
MKLRRPTVAELEAAKGKRLRDVIGPCLGVLFCGINPSLYSAAVGHHFARPGNRFWPALFAGGFTDRLLGPGEDRLLLEFGCGVTNLASRATVAADELSAEELRTGAAALRRKVRRYQPAWVAFVGIGAYRVAFGEPKARMGPQERRICDSGVWVLPNTSGLNANHQAEELGRLFGELRAINATERVTRVTRSAGMGTDR